MECLECRTIIAYFQQIIFYQATEKDVSLVLAPEHREVVVQNHLFIGSEAKKCRPVLCKKCFTVIAVETKFGPGGTSIISFSKQDVILLGVVHRKRDKWSTICQDERFVGIQKRTDKNFFQDEHGGRLETTYTCPSLPPIRFLHPSKVEESICEDWHELLVMKIPKDYQTKCYIEAVQKDLVVILPTGTGKTLIACLLLHKFRRLNPGRMGLFLVDRIPLVFQQQKVISLETGLRVLGMTGQNKTRRMLTQLHRDEFDVLVTTAGLFFHLLEKEFIFFEMFSCAVFDEAHHCQGNHIYMKVINKLFLLPNTHKPRILGLTASPVKANTVTKAQNNLQKLAEAFRTNSFYQPRLGNLQLTSPEYISFRNTELQLQLSADILDAYNNLAEVVNASIDEGSAKDFRLTWADRLEYCKVKGEINAAHQLRDQHKQRSKWLGILEMLLEIQEITESMGVYFAAEILRSRREELSQYLPVDRYLDADEMSPKLEELMKLVNSIQGEESRTLVFVETRECARRLKEHLAEQFPKLDPDLAVGHSGWDGQHWEGKQEKIIDNFRKGRCRLLLSTSVLEEGIDVSQCDLVVRFSGVATLIQFIQSRGRARKQNSRFVLLYGENDVNRAMEMEEQYRNMEEVLEEHASTHNVFSSLSQKIFNQLEAQEVINKKQRRKLRQLGGRKSRTSVEFVVCTEREIRDTLILEEEVIEELANFGLEVEKIIISEGKAAELNSSLFRGVDLHVLVQVVDEDEEAVLLHTLYIMFTRWNFRILDDLPVFSSIKFVENSDLYQDLLSWNVNSLGCGVFADRQTFEQTYVLEQSMTLKFSPSGKNICVLIEDKEQPTFMLELSLLRTFVVGFALASLEGNQCQLYIPVECMPTLWRLAEDGETKTRETKHDILTNLSKYPVISIQIDVDGFEGWFKLRQVLEDDFVFPLMVVETRIDVTEADDEIEIDNFAPSKQDFEQMKKLLEDEWIILSQATDMTIHPKISEVNEWLEKVRISYSKCNIQEAKKVCAAISLVTRKHKLYWSSFGELVEEEMKGIEQIKTSELVEELTNPMLSKYQFKALQLVVTPSRYLFLPAISMTESRLSRMLSNRLSLVVVAFRDENLNKADDDDNIHVRVEDCLVNGIDLYGRKAFFLCASASQLRDHKAFFVIGESFEEIEEIRKRIIPNPESFTSTAKYLSRLGLFGTADRSVGDIEPALMAEIPDMKAENGSLVTDGAGYIKESLARDFIERAGLNWAPSAIQFRYGGLKGVLVILPDSHDIFQKYDVPILFRRSQVKFSTDHKEFGIVKVATLHNVQLNRESITLLESLFLSHHNNKEEWNFPDVIGRSQDAYLAQTAEMFQNTSTAYQALSQYLEPKLMKTVMNSNFDILNEPFFVQLLRCVHRMKVSDLCTKANIPIQNGCLVMGIPDYSDKLQTDQIFLQIRKGGEPAKVVTGRAIIYRNPCFHPGDVRVVEAVDVPELHFSQNVVILPTTRSAYSLSMSCSGGDLDGDQFSVIWDNAYIPPTSVVQDPLDYEHLAGSSAEESRNANNPKNLADFYVKCMQNDALGRVSHMHLALSDHMRQGAMDPMCKKLAESQVVAVDFPKTGINPQVPLLAIQTVMREGYPDFMEKTGETYVSKKILGCLYRSSKAFLLTYDLEEHMMDKISFELTLGKQVSDALIKKAGEVYKLYTIEMKHIMSQFALNQEEEIVLGRAIKWNTMLNSDRDKSAQYLREAYTQVKKRFLEKFHDLTPDGKELEWAAAWYEIPYSLRCESKEKPFFSFPWILHDWLCSLNKEKSDSSSRHYQVLEKELGETCLQALSADSNSGKFSLNLLKVNLEQKEEALKSIRHELREKCERDFFEVKPYGSTSVLLSEEGSDLDACVILLPAAELAIKENKDLDSLQDCAKHRHFLRNYISPVLDELFIEKVDLIDSRIPLIKGKMENGIKVDVSFNAVGLLKTRYLLRLYSHDVAYFPVVWILIRWARCSGIIKFHRLEDDDYIMETAAMYAFVIRLLETPSYDSMTPNDDDVLGLDLPSLLDYLQDWLDKDVSSSSGIEERIGKLLLTFFQRGQTLDDKEIMIEWPIEGAGDVTITKNNVLELKKACQRGYHILVRSRDARQLFVALGPTSFAVVKKLPPSLSNAIGKGMDFHARRLSTLTRAKVTIFEEPYHKRLVLRGEGPRRTLVDLLNQVMLLNQITNIFSIGIPRRRSSKYFMAGSMLMTVRGSQDFNSKICFTDCQGDCHPFHKVHQRSSVLMKYSKLMETKDWIDCIAVPKLQSKIIEQLGPMIERNDSKLHHLEVTSRFGTFYTLNIEDRLPKTQISIRLDDFIAGTEKGKCLRKCYEKDFLKAKKPIQKLSETSDETPMKMKELSQKRGDKNVQKTSKDLEKKDKGSGNIMISYIPGVFNPNTSDDQLLQESSSKEVFVKTLEGLGFSPDAMPGMSRICEEEKWLSNFVTKQGDELQLILDDQLKPIYLKDRNASVVHATFFHGQELAPTSEDLLIPATDLRFHLQTAVWHQQDSWAFKTIFEDGKDENLPLEITADGKPRPTEKTRKDNKKSLNLVKENDDILVFKKGDIQASVISGKMSTGTDLKEEYRYCHLSLYFPPEQLIQAFHHPTKLKALVKMYLEESIQVSEALEINIKEFNEDWKQRNKNLL